MKKTILLMLSVMLAFMQVDAQVIVNATKSGYVQNTSSTNTTFYDAVIKLKEKTISWSRVGYLEVPITETVAPSQVDLKVYFYKASSTGDFPVEFATKAGALPADLGFVTQPADMTVVETQTVNNPNSFGWITVNITDEYNAALQANEEALSIRMVSEQAAVLEFYSLATGTANKPHLSIISNCPPEYNTIEKTLVEGQSIVINGETVTQTGTYEEKSTTNCGAEKIDTYHVLFITDGTVTNNEAICQGSSYKVQVGPNDYTTYNSEGQYTDVIVSDDQTATQTINTNITVNALPTAQNLGADTEIREGETLTLDAGSGFNAYQWTNLGNDIDGETNQTLNVVSTKDAFVFGTNEINVKVTDANGCVGTANMDIWVDIIGNYVAPAKDMYLEEAGDRLLDITRLEVKYDTWGDQNNETAGAPYYSKEIHLAFDLTNADLPENATNFKLKMFMYALDDNPKQPIANPTVNIDCDYADGLYADDMIWTTRTEAADRTPLASALTATEALINTQVEWDINDIFVSDILGQKNQFTIILSIPNDSYSILAKFRDVTNSNIDVRPAITFDISGTTTAVENIEEPEVKLMPNPVQSNLYIKSNEQFETVKIYNMLSQVVLSKNLTNNQVNVSELPKGQYIVSLINKNNRVSKMIIKE